MNEHHHHAVNYDAIVHHDHLGLLTHIHNIYRSDYAVHDTLYLDPPCHESCQEAEWHYRFWR